MPALNVLLYIRKGWACEVVKSYTLAFIAVCACVPLMVGCAQPSGHRNHAARVHASEAVIGDPGVTVLGLGGIPDEKRDKVAEIARQYVSGFLNWSDQAVYVVKRRTSNGYDLGWTVDVCKVMGHDEFGQPRFNYDERRIVTLNRKEHIVDYYNSGGPFLGPLA